MSKLGNNIQCLGMAGGDMPADAWDDLPSLTMGEQGKCAHCGKKLVYNVICQNERGDVFVLGRDCAKADDSVHKLSLKSVEEKAADAQLRSLVKSPEFEAWAKAKPHPKGWANKTLLDDVQFWVTRKPAYVKETINAFKASRGQASDTEMSTKDKERIAVIQSHIDALEKSITDYDAAKVEYKAKMQRFRVKYNSQEMKEKMVADPEFKQHMDDHFEFMLDDEPKAPAYDFQVEKDCAKLKRVLNQRGIEAPTYPTYKEFKALFGLK